MKLGDDRSLNFTETAIFTELAGDWAHVEFDTREGQVIILDLTDYHCLMDEYGLCWGAPTEEL